MLNSINALRKHKYWIDRVDWTRRLVPLHISISVLVSLLSLTLGLLLITLTFSNQKEAALKSTQIAFQRATQLTADHIHTIVSPAKLLTGLTAEMVDPSWSRDRRVSEMLPYFRQALLTTPWLISAYVGYEDGSFIQVKPLRDDQTLRKSVNAPQNAAYLLVESTIDESGIRALYSFFDSALNLVSTSSRFEWDYDPRLRSWYQQAIKQKDIVAIKPYRFASSGLPGVTSARQLTKGKGVVGVDILLSDIKRLLGQNLLTKNSEIVIFEENGTVFTYVGAEESVRKYADAVFNGGLNIKDLDRPGLDAFYKQYIIDRKNEAVLLLAESKRWFGYSSPLTGENDESLYIGMISPFEELMHDAIEARRKNITISVVVISLAIVIGLVISRRISKNLQLLAEQAEHIRNFEFDYPIDVHSNITEIAYLSRTMAVMKTAIQRFIDISRGLSAEKDMARVLELILEEARSVTGADGGSVALVSDDGRKLEYQVVKNQRIGKYEGGVSGSPVSVAVVEIDTVDQTGGIDLYSVRQGEIVILDENNHRSDLDLAGIQNQYKSGGYSCQSLLAIPLFNRQDEVVGLLQLVNARDKRDGKHVGFSHSLVSYVQALSANAGLALDNNRLLRAQKELFDAFVQLLAGAIDTKSVYTGGHCQRVPVLAESLAVAAAKTEYSPFSEFSLTESERYELYVASWLHDCGKITTPEYVVDKATKLETIYNRIHEVRMRFEVIWRDLEIDYLRENARNGEDVKQKKELERQRAQLREEFAFVADANLGGEYMSPENIERLKSIGQRGWMRYFDNRVGLSQDEMARMDGIAVEALPAIEKLLTDKPEHIVIRAENERPFGENPYGFQMDVPENSENSGELYNLSVNKGTLTEEERFKINNHIVQTIQMLKRLPFPKEMDRVPDWAGSHHEKLDGTGYPRGLGAEELSIPERVMAIADIFEALTASDRPYKQAKSLNQSLHIMSLMRNEHHICPDLFDLFLTTGVFKEYAEAYLRPEQIDKVNINDFLSVN
ncbi:MAG: HD domain-containing protein [Gammaproteobacteria bacterium]|nr:HD domain-containing protein [Gammaproteobacteria bacterium]